jgi:N-methylhydantoinase A/oxoprolinase/acetone carboxylase beta subunit
MLVAPRSRHLQWGINQCVDTCDEQSLKALAERLQNEGTHALVQEDIDPTTISARYSLELRYQGQSHCLSIDWNGTLKQATETFHASHHRRYGHQLKSAVEIATISVALSAPASTSFPSFRPNEGASGLPMCHVSLHDTENVPLYQREQLRVNETLYGPLIIGESISTTWVKHGWRVTLDARGNLQIDHAQNP